MNWVRQLRVRAVSVRATIAWLEVIARRNPGKAPGIIARIRKLERVALFADRYATRRGKEEREVDRGSGSNIAQRSDTDE